jgi:hypothetical protein
MFVHNARRFLTAIKKAETPFVFTLYPGFQMNEPRSDEILRQICESRNLRKIITTQRITYDYVSRFVDEDKIAFIYGGVFPSERLAATIRREMPVVSRKFRLWDIDGEKRFTANSYIYAKERIIG